MNRKVNHNLEIKSRLKRIKDEVLNCKRCELYKTRTYPVIGQGSHIAKIIMVGEAPWFNEDKTGIPFCGQAGKVLDELLNLVNIKRKDIYITNVLKCRPPNNRDPLKKEIEACSSYLLRQLKIIRPKIICCLGNFATRFIMEQFNLSDKIEGIGKIHGKIFSVTDNSLGKLYIVPLYHPAVATYNVNIKGLLSIDFKVLNDLRKR